MATITIQGTNEVIETQTEVAAFLEQQEVIYEHWDISKLPEHLREKFQLSDEEKEEILQAFKTEIDDISERRGYKTADIISLSDATPNLDEMLKNFQQEHHHKDDEVRFIVSGHGVFVIQGKDERFFEAILFPYRKTSAITSHSQTIVKSLQYVSSLLKKVGYRFTEII